MTPEPSAVVRWSTAARLADCSRTTIRRAAKAAGISPIFLTGRSRSFGLRRSDIERLLAGQGMQRSPE